MTSNSSSRNSLTHVDDTGAARMVDVSDKPVSQRQATACSRICMSKEAAQAIRQNSLAKGDCIQVARIAAIQGSKWTSHLIPLCHAVDLTSVEASCDWISDTCLEWTVTVKSTGQTGVEMEALTAASIAALTVYDLCKSIDRSMTITDVCLLEKSGGTRGDYTRTYPPQSNRT